MNQLAIIQTRGDDLFNEHQDYLAQISATVDIDSMTDDERWHFQRRLGIGGSDLGAVLGVNSYKTPVDVWLEKTGRRPPEDLSHKDHVVAGQLVEDAIARFYELRTGEKVRRSNVARFHPAMPWFNGNIDRAVEGRRKILECKNTGLFTKGWGEPGTDQVPDSYLLQVTQYMAIWGYEEADLAVLIGGNRFERYCFEFDAHLFAEASEVATDFWFNNVIADVPPPPSTFEDLAELYARDNGLDLQATPEIRRIVEERKQWHERMKQAEGARDWCDFEIKKYMQHMAVLLDGDQKLATWKSQSSKTLDQALLKEEQPAIVKQYTKTNEFRVLRV